MEALRFPLYRRAEAAGVLDGESALIVAPTATGKSHIGREAVCRALERGAAGTHAYLLPYRALADEVHQSFLESLDGTEARVRISTGDHRDPVDPAQADLIVATYESFAGLMRSADLDVGVVVADEAHLIADASRGPQVETLFARLLAGGRATAVCALSAVIDNGAQLATWLGVQLIEGATEDRAVPLTLSTETVEDLDAGAAAVVARCRDGEQSLVFCSSRNGTERMARKLAEATAPPLSAGDGEALAAVAEELLSEDPDAGDLAELVRVGVAYHHAGLARVVRRVVERAVRDRRLRVIAATPTLAAGVNLPAGVAIVRDVFRSEYVRGQHRSVLLPSGEVLNMLGRAARPHQVAEGRGIALIERRFAREEIVRSLASDVERCRGGSVRSRLPESYDGLMRFVLGIVADRGEATRDDVAEMYRRTLAHHADPREICFERPFRDDIMEDIPAYERVVGNPGALELAHCELAPEGVDAKVRSGPKLYDVRLSVTGLSCSCPAASQFYRGRVCKHQAFVIAEVLFGDGVDTEVASRAIYICSHVFGETLDIGTRLDQAIDILTRWRLLERMPSGWRATPFGEVAASSWFDLLLIHEISERLVDAPGQPDHRTVARWAVEDFYGREHDRARWLDAVEQWLDEVDERSIRLPRRYRGDFESGLDELAQVCRLYEKAAEALDKRDVAAAARAAAKSLRYGVAPELVPIVALGFPQLGRGRSRLLYERGIRNVADLATADAATLADARRMPQAIVAGWIERAQEIVRARAVADADREEADAEFDELVARFQIDPAALA